MNSQTHTAGKKRPKEKEEEEKEEEGKEEEKEEEKIIKLQIQLLHSRGKVNISIMYWRYANRWVWYVHTEDRK